MTPRDFAYWLQGYMEVHGEHPNAEEWEIIKDHLKLVFTKVTPDRQETRPIDEDVKKSPLDIDFDEILKKTRGPWDNDQILTDPFAPPYEVTCSVFCAKPEVAC